MSYKERKLYTCPTCNKEFYPNVHNQKYCSIKCRDKSKYKRIKQKHILTNNLCACGCGNYTYLNPKTNKPYRYIFKHYRSHENSLKAIKCAMEARRLKINWQEVAKLYTEKGLFYTEIAKQLNCCSATVSRNLHKLGIETKKIKGFYTSKGGYEISTLTGKPIHREIMEKQLGRTLLFTEHVHHKNGIRNDNRIENLEVLNASQHHKDYYQLLHENQELKRELELLKANLNN